MTDRENVIKKLEKLLEQSRFNDSVGWNPDCDTETLEDAVALLKAQEPRVITFDEIVAVAPGTVVWLEDYDKTDVIAGLVKKIYIYTKVVDFLIVNEKVNDEVTADLECYGEGWRCWTSRPTDEQREATPWEP